MTSTDVAREAGLSRATVSYVLNGDPRQQIPEPTRQRVLEAAARLGYRPYGPARLLRGARSKVVLMLTPGLQRAADFVAAGIISQLGEELATKGLHLVWQLGDTELHGASVDLAPAVVLSSATEDEETFAKLVQQFDVPVLAAFPGLPGFIGGAASAQVEHLVERGRRRLAFAFPGVAQLQPTAEIRWAAVQDAARRLDLEAPVRFDAPDDRSAATTALIELLDAHPDVDGICAYNDAVAFAVLAAASDADVAVPDRIAVIGVDNHPFGTLAIPALSTVEADVHEFVTAFAQNVARVAGGEDPLPIRLPERSQPVVRRSS
ncbi:LacI family DNA-binding transcriptional regulator [Lysobacter korlensis]|uniref:LacI family DNA-binding transcriptional regulator n=1 Tax=Lysobacter korlensis TaxID=553636 RepID=A0ABV6RXN6_9GAMM